MVYLSKCSEDQLLPLMQKTKDCVWIEHPANKKPIGEGTSGVIYQVCCLKKDDEVKCKYVIKVMKGRKESEVKREVEYQQRFMEAGTGIPILDAYMCPSEGTSYIVMEKRDKDLLQYSNILADSNMTDEEVYQKLKELQEDAFEIIDKSFEKGLIHTDLIPDNWMLNVEEDLSYDDLVLIDFGYARDKTSKDNLERIKGDLGLSFKRLLKNIIEKRHSQHFREEEMRKSEKKEGDFLYEMKIDGRIKDRLENLVDDVYIQYLSVRDLDDSFELDTPKGKKAKLDDDFKPTKGGMFDEEDGFYPSGDDDFKPIGDGLMFDEEDFEPIKGGMFDEDDFKPIKGEMFDEDDEEEDKPKKRKLFFGDSLQYYFN